MSVPNQRAIHWLQDMKKANRIFYLSIPPSIFTAVAGCASKAASSPTGWTRVIVEKPFGKDSESFAQLERELSSFLSEEQMYRIDHYLGKELIENLTVCLLAGMSFPFALNLMYHVKIEAPSSFFKLCCAFRHHSSCAILTLAEMQLGSNHLRERLPSSDAE